MILICSSLLGRISVLLPSVSCGQRNENPREPSLDCMMDDKKFPVQNPSGGCATVVYREEGQCLVTTFLFSCSELPIEDVQSHAVRSCITSFGMHKLNDWMEFSFGRGLNFLKHLYVLLRTLKSDLLDFPEAFLYSF